MIPLRTPATPYYSSHPMSDPRVRLVLNPQAGSGAARRKLPEIVRAFQKWGVAYEVAGTSGPGDASRIARASFDDGIDVIAVAGGDGTLNEVSQAYLSDDGTPRSGPDLAIIPIGTGGDFKRTLGLSGSIEQAVERLSQAKPRAIDLGVLELDDHTGARAVRAFVNITSFGMGGVTDKLVNEAPKFMGGKAAFFIGTTRAMFAYRNAPVRVAVDGKEFVNGPIFNVAVANGRFFGGGMMIAPEADPSDGLFEVVALGDLSRTAALSLSTKIYKGLHIGTQKVSATRGKVIEAESSGTTPVLIDMDGETPGRLPLRIRVAEGLLRVRA
ncbi:MAG: diacylglycerol kinase family lipid kinase [Deltaproteobacteria bacterium]|nr:diacylglycerol kinase family lipid kinase [Deltaproteobacteria bacterium]